MSPLPPNVNFQYLDTKREIGIIEVDGQVRMFSLGGTLAVQAVSDDAKLGFPKPIPSELVEHAKVEVHKLRGTTAKFGAHVLGLLIRSRDGHITASEAWQSITKEYSIFVANYDDEWYKDRILFYRAWLKLVAVFSEYAKEHKAV